ncbi:MAG: pyridoxamine 5'-phosphate oxidase family protein [Thermodesulfobacteriota bacterium]
MLQQRTLNPEEIKAFMPAEKVGLVATVDPAGLPHITLITSIRAAGPGQLTLGEFCKGSSKTHIRQRHQVGFLIMTMDRRMWRGKACWTHSRGEGPEYEQYNDLPTFRYNAYFGINTVHYLDLVAVSEGEALPMGRIVKAALLTKLAKGGAAGDRGGRILKPFAEEIFNRLDALKFIAYVGADGYPVILPAIQCQAADSRRLTFSLQAFGAELARIPKDSEVAVFGLTMAMEDVLVRGRYRGTSIHRMVRLGVVDIDWVYNSMPPCHGQIYPPVPLKAVVNF